ncbi:MAG: F0F1 ATP synthase subunit B family protein [Alphaproteobacteria bacterium]
MLQDPTFWVAVSFFMFVGVIVYFKVPGLVAKALDGRAEAIRQELEQARRLREEAQALLAQYQRKQSEAEKEAQDIIAQAKQEAELLAVDMREKLTQVLERRAKSAEEKIALAETQAVKELRSRAAEIAVLAAEKLITNELSDVKSAKLIDQSIADLKSRLN